MRPGVFPVNHPVKATREPGRSGDYYIRSNVVSSVVSEPKYFFRLVFRFVYQRDGAPHRTSPARRGRPPHDLIMTARYLGL